MKKIFYLIAIYLITIFNLQAQTPGTWTYKTSIPIDNTKLSHVTAMQGFQIADKEYIFITYNIHVNNSLNSELWIYQPTTNVWTLINSPISYDLCHYCTISSDNRYNCFKDNLDIYILIDNQKLYRYNTVYNTWSYKILPNNSNSLYYDLTNGYRISDGNHQDVVAYTNVLETNNKSLLAPTTDSFTYIYDTLSQTFQKELNIISANHKELERLRGVQFTINDNTYYGLGYYPSVTYIFNLTRIKKENNTYKFYPTASITENPSIHLGFVYAPSNNFYLGSMSAFSIGGKGYFGCGFGYQDGYGFQRKNIFLEYDTLTNHFVNRADFPGSSRASAIGFAILNKGYIGGGINIRDTFYSGALQLHNAGFLKDFYEYTPCTNLVIPTVTITANGYRSIKGDTIEICKGDALSFKAKNVNGGDKFSLQWKTNGIPPGVYQSLYPDTSYNTGVINDSINLYISHYTVQCFIKGNHPCYKYTQDTFSNTYYIKIHPYHTFFNDTFCFGTSYHYNPTGTNISVPGQYTFTLRNIYGCDSIVTLNLFEKHVPTNISYLDSLICDAVPALAYASADVQNPTFHWSNGVNAPSANFTSTGFYNVYATYNGACRTDVRNFHIGSIPDCAGAFLFESESIINIFDTLTVKVKVVGAHNLFSIFAKLTYDKNRLKFIDSRMGDFLGSNVLTQPPVVSNGTIDFGMTKTSGQSGSNGSGVVYIFRFKVAHIPNSVFDTINPSTTITTIKLINPVVNDATGAVSSIRLPQPDDVKIRYYIPVWPGDLDNNKIVNVGDILPIGYFYGYGGEPRVNASLIWRAQFGKIWYDDISESNSLGYSVFADGNGNGIIDLADQNSIGFNLSKTHLRLNPTYVDPVENKLDANDVPLWVDIADTVITRAQLPKNIIAHVNLGTAVNPYSNMYGIAFDLLFNPAYIDVNNITLNYNNCVFGALSTNYIRVEENKASSGRISIGLTRYNTTELSGFGNIVDITLPVKTSGPGNFFKLTAVPLSSNTKTGVPISIAQGKDSVRVDQIISAIKQSSIISTITKIYPNPASKEINVDIQTKQATDIQIKIIDLKGAEMYSKKIIASKGQLLQTINVSDYPKGLYIIQLIDKTGMTSDKFLVE